VQLAPTAVPASDLFGKRRTPADTPLDPGGSTGKDEDRPRRGVVTCPNLWGVMDEAESDRIDRYLYPRPPADVIDAAALAGLREPGEQTWARSVGLHVERPLRFRCGAHPVRKRDPGPVNLLDLAGTDGKTYRIGQCRLCGRIFWGVKGEPSPTECRYLGGVRAMWRLPGRSFGGMR
jgi:hypothetical protein